jgi:glutathione S-transferase
MPATLITIRFSHFCEKARWALDHARFSYREDAHAPGFHMLATRPRGGRSVPMLVTRHGVLRDSTDIMKFADRGAPIERRIYPDDDAARAEVDALVALFDATLGPATRLLAYHHGLAEPARLTRIVGGGMSRAERLRLRMVLPIVRPLMRRAMRIREDTAVRATERIRAIFDDVSSRVSDGRRFFFGDRLGAADITFASLAGPILLQPGHPHYASDLTDVAPVLQPLIEEMRATAAGRFACALYREHRAPAR